MADGDFGSRIHFGPFPAAGAASSVPSGALWLDGEALTCACPQCQAPMSVRLWLLVADCGRCGTSIELTEEQEQQALELLRRRGEGSQAMRPAEPRGTPAQPAAPAEPLALKSAAAATPARPKSPWSMPVGEGHASAAPNPAPACAAAHWAASPAPAAPYAGNGFAGPPVAPDADESQRRWAIGLAKELPCWLVSAVIHMLLIIALGVWVVRNKTAARPLILAAEVNQLDQEGDAQRLAPLADQPEFEPPGAVNLAPTAAIDPFSRADVEPFDMAPIVGEAVGDLFSPSDTTPIASGPADPSKILAGRNPRVRSQLALREGGTTESEAAVTRALKWLAAHQNSDGSWSLHRFDHAGDCNGRCGEAGRVESDTSATALALLPFLDAGQTHLRGDYNLPVARGLRWLMDQQKPDGDLRGHGGGNMYAHGQTAIVLCEAYALTQTENLRDPAQRAIDFIVQAQHPEGGWRYHPGEAGDLSVVGWQMMALRSAQMAYLNVPPDVFTKATKFLSQVQTDPKKGIYDYMAGKNATPPMTAEGLLCRQYSGWRQNNPQLRAGVDWLRLGHLPRRDQVNMYYWYYGTQVMHHMGGEPWQEWNDALRDVLIALQATTGHEAGSWAPGGGHDSTGGRLYMTALATCTLEVYYRHMPLYRHPAAGHDGAKKPRGKQ